MKPLSAERKYILEIIEPESGCKSSLISITLGELIDTHNSAMSDLKEHGKDADYDPYVNIFCDVTDGLENTANLKIPIFRMSTLKSLLEQEQSQ